MRQRLHAPTAVVVALMVGSLANLAQFPSIEYSAGDWYRAVRVKVSHELHDLVDTHFASTQARFAVYMDLREYAYGATVVVPEPVRLNVEQLNGLSGAGALERPAELIEISDEVASALDADVVAEGEFENFGPYSVVVPRDGAPDRVLVVTGATRTYLVTPELLRAAGGEVPG